MRITAATLALIAALTGGTIVAAQEGSRATGKVVEGADANPELVIIDIDYPGGNVADYLLEVGRVSGYSNIVAKPGLERLEMPPVTLRRVSVIDAVAAVESMTGGQMWVKQNGSVLVCLHQMSNPTSPPDHRESHVWSIMQIVDSGASTDDILGAIELADAMTPGESEIKFHEATGLVFALGTEEDLQAIDRTIDTLSSSYRTKGQQAQSRETLVYTQQLEGDLLRAKQQITAMSEQLRNESARGMSLRQQLDALETERTAAVTELQVRLDAAQTENASLQSRIKHLEASLAQRPGN